MIVIKQQKLLDSSRVSSSLGFIREDRLIITRPYQRAPNSCQIWRSVLQNRQMSTGVLGEALYKCS